MKTKIQIIIFILIGIHSYLSLAGSNSNDPIFPTIEGVMGVTPATEFSCAAIWLAIPEGQALAGIEWFNNDGTIAFPGLFFESGVPENPVSLDQTLLAAENVTGDSGAWSTVEFSEPVTCANEGLYLVFRFPVGQEVSAFGAGGGPAIGYVADGAGAPGWLCADGQSWDKVGGDFGFAVLPALVAGSEDMIQLNGATGPVEPVTQTLPLATTLHFPFPNPFNPQTEISFSLATYQKVDLSIFDIRGHRILILIKDNFPAGKHSLTWTGLDQTGRRVASGIYFVRFQAGDISMSHRLLLIK